MFTDIFIKRPVLASVVSLLILLIGFQAYTKLAIRQYPELSSTTITITTAIAGNGPTNPRLHRPGISAAFCQVELPL